MHDRQKVFHVNMLKRFYPPEAAGYWVEEKCVEDDEDMPGWKSEEGGPLVVSDILSDDQKQQLHTLLATYSAVLQLKQGRQT